MFGCVNSLVNNNNFFPLFRDDSDVMNEAFIDVILMRFSRKLLQAGQLRKFGHLVAYLDFPLATFLSKERFKAARVEDYPLALKNLHRDFEFPYPSYVPSSGKYEYFKAFYYSFYLSQLYVMVSVAAVWVSAMRPYNCLSFI